MCKPMVGKLSISLFTLDFLYRWYGKLRVGISLLLQLEEFFYTIAYFMNNCLAN